MAIRLNVPTQTELSPRIVVFGVGGAGGNAVNNMISMGLEGVEFLVANTDAQSLIHARADRRVQLGPHLTQGLGAGAKPEIGRAAAEEATEELARHIEGMHMIFITAGMGGGTGTGAAPVIARMAQERGILTVGVVTKPFDFEGPKRRKSAEQGIEELQQCVDTLIIIPNQNLFRLANERTTFQEAFKMADNVLYMGVRGVTDLMINPGIVNLDFADIRTIMAEMGKAMMGTGEADGEDRARRAAESAISNPLLEDISMRGAKGVLINITGGYDMTLFEVDGAVNRIREEVEEDANIIFGTSVDETMNGRIRVSVVATGIDVAGQREAEKPKLVAMGGGAAQLVNAVSNQSIGAAPSSGPGLPFMRRAAQTTPTLRPAVVETTPAPEVEIAPASQQEAPVMLAPAPMGEPEMPQLRVPVAEPAEPQPAAAPRSAGLRGLFGKVTGMGGMMKRNISPAAEPQGFTAETAQTARIEPTSAPAPRFEAARPSQQDEMSLEIPAFLRRQRS